MEWVGASVIAPLPLAAIEFELASEAGVRRGYFRDLRFYCVGDPAGYPRKMVRRWRYIDADQGQIGLASAVGY